MRGNWGGGGRFGKKIAAEKEGGRDLAMGKKNPTKNCQTPMKQWDSDRLRWGTKKQDKRRVCLEKNNRTQADRGVGRPAHQKYAKVTPHRRDITLFIEGKKSG